MKKARSVALNYAFIGLVVSVVISVILWFFDKSLTGQAYEYQFINFFKIEMPKIGIQFLPVIVTLLTFQWVYLKRLFLLSKGGFSPIFAIAFSIVVLMEIIIVVADFKPNEVSAQLALICGFLLIGVSIVSIFNDKELIPCLVIGVVFVNIIGTLFVFLAVLLHTSLGVAEAFYYSWNIFAIVMIISLTLSAVLPILVAIGERIILIIKTPEVVDVSRTTSTETVEKAVN